MSGASAVRFTAFHDVELCGYAAAGERRAFGELVRRHSSGVRQLLRRMGAQPAESDDVAQDAFLAAFERIAEFRGDGTFAGWIKRIAARLYLRRLQKERRLVGLRRRLSVTRWWRRRRTLITASTWMRASRRSQQPNGCVFPCAMARACPTPKRPRP